MSSDSIKVPHVLVVEDEMMLRMRAVDIVEDAGFCSVEAVNADEALSVLESRSDISLLFTDIQMPGSMDGLKLAHAVHDRWPSIKIILVSGQVNPSDAEKPADSRFFGKPLSVEKMISELQGMVGAGALRTVPNPALLRKDETLPGTGSVEPMPRSAQEAVLSAQNGQPPPVAGASRDRRQGAAGPGRHRRKGTRGRRQAAETHRGRIASSHQEYACDSQRHRIAEFSGRP
jgi:CheY-like chemotaxis protein